MVLAELWRWGQPIRGPVRSSGPSRGTAPSSAQEVLPPGRENGAAVENGSQARLGEAVRWSGIGADSFSGVSYRHDRPGL